MVEQGFGAFAGLRHDVAGVNDVVGADVESCEIITLHKTEHHPSGHKAGLYRQVELLGRAYAVVQKIENLCVQQYLYPVNNIAGHKFLHPHGCLSAFLQQTESDCHGLLCRVFSFCDFDQGNNLRRSVPVRSRKAREPPLRCTTERIQRRCVGHEDNIQRQQAVQFCKQSLFYIRLFGHRLLYELHAVYCFRHGSAIGNTAENLLCLCSSQQLFLDKGIQIGAHHDFGFFHCGGASGVKVDFIATRGVTLRDAGTHGAGAQHCYFFYVFKLHAIPLSPIFLPVFDQAKDLTGFRCCCNLPARHFAKFDRAGNELGIGGQDTLIQENIILKTYPQSVAACC